MAAYTDRALLRRVYIQVRPYRLQVVAVFLLYLLATPLALLAPVPLKIVVDNVLGSEPFPGLLKIGLPTADWSDNALLVFALALLLAIAMLKQLQTLASSMLRTATGERLVLNFRVELFRHVQRLSLAYHDTRGTADALYRIQFDAPAIQYLSVDSIPPFISASITFLSMVYVIFRIEWRLSLIALAISPLLFAIARAYRRRLRAQAYSVKGLESGALTVVQEVLSALRVVIAFGQEEREQKRFVGKSIEGMRARLRYTLAENGLGLLLAMTTAVGTTAVLFIGVRSIQAGTLTLGDLLLVMGYLSQLYDPLKTISKQTTSLQTHFVSAERAYALLDEMPGVVEKQDARALVRAIGAVTFRDVSFSYDGNRAALEHVSFEAPAGSRVGITGRTGAGKSTLVSLLSRFYDPTAGQILIDGVDLRDFKVADLRNQFAIVLQEPVLFSTSIAENIAYGRPHASEEEIIAAAKAANAHEFVSALPDGYAAQVGERGMRLSGGERQRIALAQAFLTDAPILILDEPTSSIDINTESAIMEAMERLMQGRTTFLIAHRLTTLERCDLLLVVDNGRLVATRSDVATVIRGALAAGDLEPMLERDGI